MTAPTVDPTASLTAALVETNDQLLAMYELVTLSTDSLDETEVIATLLRRAAEVARVDGLVLHTEPPHRHGLDDGNELIVRVPGTESDQTVELSARRRNGEFGTGDTKLLTAVATMAVSAIRTARLHRDGIAQAVVRNDHATASILAQDALPAVAPSIDGLRLAARSIPARSAGGDLYAWHDDTNAFRLVVGDVSGKGLPAAIMMTNVVAAANARFADLNGAADPSEASTLLHQLDNWLGERLSAAARFVTLVSITIDPATGRAGVANAGHSPVFVVRRTGAVEPIPPVSPPIGVLPIDDAGALEVELAVGDRIVVGSDGLTEQESPTGEFFGDERLVSTLISTPGATSGIEAVLDAVERHGADAEQSDDRTIVIIERTERGSAC